MEHERNLKISGSGSMSGGKYNEVGISGSGKVTGDIECREIKISGSGKIEGNVTASIYKSSGSSKVMGNLKCEDMKISGSAHLLGNVEGKNIDISGSTKIEGKLSGEDVKVSGSVIIGEDCEVENFKACGGFNILGLLNAEDIEIQIQNKCNVKEIGGKNISIKNMENLGFNLFNLFGKKRLYTQVIEGDNIYLENTVAKVVRGNDVCIGDGCEIELLEYSKSMENKGDSRILQIKEVK